MTKSVEGFRALGQIGPITLGEMDCVKLMNRVDTKYLTSVGVLERVLEEALRQGYRALVVEGSKISPYNSLYYDTPSLGMFLDHHNRRSLRQKVRTRVYLASGATFLEIKRKNNKGRTKKKRMQIPPDEFWDFRCDSAAALFLAEKSRYTSQDIAPRLETIFRRITLVNRSMTERLTIDFDLRFVNHDTGMEASLGPAVIIELKQDGRVPSEMKGILLDLRVKPVRISKYCIGTTLTNPFVKSNRFRTKVHAIEKTTGQRITIIPQSTQKSIES